jgi:hypothetical protein
MPRLITRSLKFHGHGHFGNKGGQTSNHPARHTASLEQLLSPTTTRYPHSTLIPPPPVHSPTIPRSHGTEPPNRVHITERRSTDDPPLYLSNPAPAQSINGTYDGTDHTQFAPLTSEHSLIGSTLARRRRTELHRA